MNGMLRMLRQPPFRWWALAVVGLLAVNVGVYLYAMKPVTQAVATQEQAWTTARAELTRRLIAQRAQADVERFRRLLLERKAFAQLVVRVTELARGHDLLLPDIGYSIKDVKEANVAKVAINFTVSGEYGALRRFLSDVERARELLTIEDLSLTKAKAGSLAVRVQIAAYLRASSKGPA